MEELRGYLLGGAGGLQPFHSVSGVLLLAYSMLMTRGPAEVRADMDDRDNTLTGQFGHCTQEVSSQPGAASQQAGG